MISIREVALHNNVNLNNTKQLSLAELVQESYTLYYDLQKQADKRLIKLGEQLIEDIQNNPRDLERLTEDYHYLGNLALLDNLGLPVGEPKKQVVPKRSKRKARMVKEESDPESQIVWEEIKPEMENFIQYTKGKAFVKGLRDFNTIASEGEELTQEILIDLHKALNSTLTHLAIELEKNPDFHGTYIKVTQPLQGYNREVYRAIAQESIVDTDTLQAIMDFSDLLLDTETTLDPIYEAIQRKLREEYPEESEEIDPIDDFEILPPDDLEGIDDEFTIEISKQELDTILNVLDRIALAASSLDYDEDEMRDEFNSMLGDSPLGSYRQDSPAPSTIPYELDDLPTEDQIEAPEQVLSDLGDIEDFKQVLDDIDDIEETE